MPVPATVPEFLDLVGKSTLVSASKLAEMLARSRAGNGPTTVDQAAAALVRDAQLTFFQAKQIKIGRYKRFNIGEKYRLLELIGIGGMGAVYLCEHTMMRRLVALKVLPVDKLDDNSNLERFYREARAVAALDHPNIVRAYDIDKHEKLHFLVMEYVDGSSLQEVVARYAVEKKQFDPVRAAQYIAQAAVGMQHAHELGMVHRDIKPGNLLLDRSGVIKVLDMGLARFFNKQQDSVTEKYDDKCVLGTADYLAPEQAVSNIVDVRADIYSLGGTLYFMLTGLTPFPDGTIAAKLVAHQTRDPRPVEAIRSDVPAGILDVLRKMMSKRPEDRYQEPIEVAEALAEWADQPMSPPPEREMPALCPLVQQIAGPSPERTGAHAPLARVLFAPGRGVFGRGAGSSGNISTRPPVAKPDSGATASNAAFPVAAKSLPRYAPGAESPAGGPISTSRASASPTSQLPGKVKAPAKPRPRPATPAELAAAARPASPPLRTRRRWWLYAAAGVGMVVLVAVAAVVAYQFGRGAPTPVPQGQNPPPPVVPADNDPMPGVADELLTPAQAADKGGEEQTVEFKVRSSDGASYLALNSEAEPRVPENFAVRIAASFFQSGGDRDKMRKEYEGKAVRARGIILHDPHGGWFIEVKSPSKIVSVRR